MPIPDYHDIDDHDHDAGDDDDDDDKDEDADDDLLPWGRKRGSVFPTASLKVKNLDTE